MLLVLLIIIPIIGALAVCFKKGRSLNILFITSAVSLALGIFGLKSVFTGEPLVSKILLPGPFTPSFRADPLAAVFVILASFLWFVISIYTPQYMRYEGKAKTFEIITLLTFSTVLGVFLAGDLITMLLFFELMTISSYFWVIHRWNKEAIKAGYFYLFFSIIGGLFIALAIVFMGPGAGFLPAVGSGQILPANPSFYAWSILLLVAGYGIKAGMAPLHLWLPHAHSVAPTPGSALLSGLLIKVGAYGLIRVGEFAGWGQNLTTEIVWLGPALTVLGLATMLIGVTAALLQSDAKRLLAYHSVSQMGYIILGLGVGLYLGSQGGLGLLGAIYHIVNHALFKAALFLGVGVIYIHTKETNLYSLGGLWRRFPITAVLMFLAVLGITGAPGLNGYASKSLLHHAVSRGAEAKQWLFWVERLFSLVGVGTAASFTKLFYLTFLGRPTKIKVSRGTAPQLQTAMGLLALVMVAVGLRPMFFPSVLAAPAAQALGLENAASALEGLSFWNAGDLFSTLVTLALGIGLCWAGLKSGAFHWHPPFWLTLEGLGEWVYGKIAALWRKSRLFSKRVKEASFNLITTAKQDFIAAYQDQSGSDKVGGVILKGVSADAALLIVALILLIVWYTVTNPNLPGIRFSGALFRQIKEGLFR
ncbi:MAG: proton-conducting membrane transporter [Firmicutes bacterium]|nr:proton-conducting membrane transporter [Bacillota bacterium]